MVHYVEGVSQGFHDQIRVRLGIMDNEVVSIDADYSPHALVGKLGIEQMTQKMLEQKTLDVDAVTGATFSTNAFKDACLKAWQVYCDLLTQEESMNPEVHNINYMQLDAVSSASVVPDANPENTSPVKPSISRDDVSFDRHYDVIIVGSGGAGLAAGVTVAEAGKKVLICEKAGFAGGTTNLSGGVFQAAGTPYQKELTDYHDDTPEKHAALWIKAGEGIVDESLVKDLAQHAGDNLEWLSQMGLEWNKVYGHNPIPYVKPEYQADRIHQYKGGGGAAQGVVLTQAMLSRYLELGGEIRYDAPVVQLITSAPKEVAGVVVEHAGQKEYIGANAVILATASIDRNPALAKQLHPQQYHDLLYGTILSASTNTGDGILLGLDLGGALSGVGGTIDFDGHTGNATNNQIPTIPMIIVNGNGERFVCEDATYAYQYRAIFQQEKQLMKPTYLIFSDHSITEPGSAWTPERLEADIASKKVIAAPSIEALAEAIGLSAENLATTVHTWNRHAQDGNDPVYGRTMGVKPLTGDNFYAMRNVATNLGSIGGLKINVDCQVLDTFNQPLPGLYAVGLNAGGWIGGYYPGSGTAVSGIIHQGRKAGQHIVKQG